MKTGSLNYRVMRGFTLLEVMIAVLVLSLGLLGLAGLQAYSMRYNMSANYRTQATNLASQLLDLARTHRGATIDDTGSSMAPNYNVQVLLASMSGKWTAIAAPTSAISPFCISSNPNAVSCDRERWINALRTALPQGRARTTFNPVSGVLQIEICWRDDRSAAGSDTDASAECTLASEGYGQVTVGRDGIDRTNNAYWMETRI